MLTKTAVTPQIKTNLVQLYRSILIMLLLCGFYFNVWKFKLHSKILVTSHCASLVIINMFSNFTCCPGQMLSIVWSVIEYTASVILTFVLKTQISRYFQKLTEIDTYLRIGNKYYLNTKYKIFFYIFILWTIRFVYTILYWMWFPFYDDLMLFVISQFSLVALDLNRVWRFVLFDMTRYRLKMLRCRIEEMKNYNFYCYVSDFKTLKQSRIRFCLHLYKKLADAADIIGPELHASLLISIVCTLPKLILNAYHILLVIEQLEPLSTVGFAALHVAQVTFFISAPCIAVELYAVEVERIRLLLIHKLFDDPGSVPFSLFRYYFLSFSYSFSKSPLNYRAPLYLYDETMRGDVNLFLRYTKVRPFRYYIWRVLPVTVALPLDLINLCTGYVIVIINFTHLYG